MGVYRSCQQCGRRDFTPGNGSIDDKPVGWYSTDFCCEGHKRKFDGITKKYNEQNRVYEYCNNCNSKIINRPIEINVKYKPFGKMYSLNYCSESCKNIDKENNNFEVVSHNGLGKTESERKINSDNLDFIRGMQRDCIKEYLKNPKLLKEQGYEEGLKEINKHFINGLLNEDNYLQLYNSLKETTLITFLYNTQPIFKDNKYKFRFKGKILKDNKSILSRTKLFISNELEKISQQLKN